MTIPARSFGGLIALMAVMLVRLLDGSAPPMYPGLTRPLIAAVGLAGLLITVWSSAARPAAVVGGLAALQVAGYGLVASRDWYNYAGASGASYGEAAAGSERAFTVAAAAFVALVLCLLAYRLAPAPVPTADPPRLARAWVVLSGAVVAALPVLLGAWFGTALSAVGQFTMWWTIPWGAGHRRVRRPPHPGRPPRRGRRRGGVGPAHDRVARRRLHRRRMMLLERRRPDLPR